MTPPTAASSSLIDVAWIRRVCAVGLAGALGCSGDPPAITLDGGEVIGTDPDESIEETARSAFGDSAGTWTLRGFSAGVRYFGVQMQHSDRSALAGIGSVVDEILATSPMRSTCERYRNSQVRLVLSSTVRWDTWAADPRGQALALQGDLAEARRRGVRVTLLLQAHENIPPDVERRYGARSSCRNLDDDGRRTCQWVPYPPESPFWDEVQAWQTSVGRAIADYGGDPLLAVFVLNEPQYDTQRYVDTGRGIVYGEEQLARLQARLVNATQRAIGDRAEVSIKYYAYPLSLPEAVRTRSGLSRSQLSYLCNDVLGPHLLGFDSYPTRAGYSVDSDLGALNAECRGGQRYFIAEWNVGADIGGSYRQNQASADEMASLAVRLKTSRARVVGASVFCWNCIDGDRRPTWTLSGTQRRGFASAFRSILGRNSSPCQ